MRQTREDENIGGVIDCNLLLHYGGVIKNYNKDEYIFREGQSPHFYHEVVEGKIRMVNETEDRNDFIQGFFSAGQNFGEPPIFIDDVYPASAIAAQPSVIVRLNIASFKTLLKDHFESHWNITRVLASRLRTKSIALKEISCYTPEERILSQLNNYKQEVLKENTRIAKVKIEYTRKQIGDMTGLRVETVIRVMRNLCDKKILTIEKGKVYF